MTGYGVLLAGLGLLVLAALVALILIPFHVVAEAGLDEMEADGALDVWWCWGLLGVRIHSSQELEVTIVGRIVYRRQLEWHEEEEEEDEGERRKFDWKVLLEHRETVFRVLGRFTRSVEPEAMIWGHVGLDRADHTAYLSQLLRELETAIPRVSIEIEPNYIDQSVLLRGALRALVWPAGLIAAAIELVFERRTRELIQALR